MLREVAALYTVNNQKAARRTAYIFSGEVTQPSERRLNETQRRI